MNAPSRSPAPRIQTTPWIQAAFWGSLALVVVSVVMVVTRVDLTPQIGSDFFFSTEDPQFRASQQITELFPSQDQILIRAVGEDIYSEGYLADVEELTQELLKVPDVTAVQSLTQGPAKPENVPESPIWKRLLLGASPQASQLIVTVEAGEDRERQVIIDVEEVLESHHSPSFALDISGVPYVVELIRRHLTRDLRTFSLASLIVFGLLIALIYRSWRIVLGTLVACLGACAVTLTLLHFLGKPIGLLTANIITIVFVLTLSHIVFLIANWRQEQRSNRAQDDETAIARAVRLTLQASFWCMVTTLLGFASLLFASAKPLRELGFSGALGAAVAIVIAYSLFPGFLAAEKSSDDITPSRPFPWHPGWLAITGIGLATLTIGFGVRQMDTDPNLLSYFAADSDLRHGLEMVDRGGGSSPLLFVVSRPDGEGFDKPASLDPLAAVQASFDRDPAVGVALSLPVLVAEAQRNPLAVFLPLKSIYNILESPDFGNVLRSFLTEDRRQALIFLRMRESERNAPRGEVISRLEESIVAQDLQIDLTGGLFELQAKLGDLVKRSLMTGLAGLFGLFLIIAAVVSRSIKITLAMVLALLPIPFLLLGALGHLGKPVDIISSPAANVAIALGIDSMIHLVMTFRRRRAVGESVVAAWTSARDRLWQPVVGAMLILATGFGIFALSSFPPTQRFGVAVACGTLAAAIMSLVVLPFLATVGRDQTGQAGELQKSSS